MPVLLCFRGMAIVRPDRLAVLSMWGVHWSDVDDPERVLATWRPTQAIADASGDRGADLGLSARS